MMVPGFSGRSRVLRKEEFRAVGNEAIVAGERWLVREGRDALAIHLSLISDMSRQ